MLSAPILLAMAEAGIQRDPSGALPLEWQLQAIVVVCNVLPVLVVAAVVAYASLAAAAVTGLLSLFVGGVFLIIILGYAGLCVAAAGGLWRRRSWGRLMALSILVLYILLHALPGPARPRPAKAAPANLNGHTTSAPPVEVFGIARGLLGTLSFLPILNAVAIAHLAVRWKQFSQAANSSPWL